MPNDEFSILAMVFSGNVGQAGTNQHNTDWAFRGADGALSLIEMSYKWNQGDDAKGKPGTLKLGGYYDSASFSDELTNAPLHGDYGMYAMVDQLLYREPTTSKDESRGLSAFLRAGTAPQHDRNVVTFDTEGGFNYAGLFPSRPKDLTGIAVAYTKMSNGWRLANEGSSRYETLVELTHLVVINDHFALQPDIQYIINPGALGKLDNALVIGLRFSMSY
jgi:porin